MKLIIRLAAAALLFTAMTTGNAVFAQVPHVLNYQGYLVDSSGQALKNSVVVEFSIYTVETGGAPVWSEFQDIFPSQGLFSTSFGSPGNPFPPGMFDTPLFLGIKVSTDLEMTPRTPLSAAAYRMKADDAFTVNGFTSEDLDESADVAALSGDLVATQADVAAVQSSVGQLNAGLAGAQTDISAIEGDLNAQSNDIASLESDVSSAQNDISTIQSTLPNKQDRVTGTCTTGAFMTGVNVSGTVNCKSDDTGPWSFDGDAWLASGTRVGIGTSAPAASLQIDAPPDTDPFRARVQSSTKLRVHANGSVSLGTSSAGPESGMYVRGQAGVGTNTPLARLGVADTNWQMRLLNPMPEAVAGTSDRAPTRRPPAAASWC